MDTMTPATTPETTPETYPWEQPQPCVPEVSASLCVVRATPIKPFDRPQTKTYRVIGLAVGEFSLHIGISGGDTEIVDVIDRLIEPLHQLRHAALRRLAEAEAIDPNPIDDTPPGSDDDSETPDESTPEYDAATVSR